MSDDDTLRMQVEQILSNQEDQRKALDRIDGKVDRINGQVARNTQTLAGVDGRGGLIDDVRNLFKIVERFRRDRMPPGTVSLKTVWGAVAALAAVGGMVAAFMFGGGG